RCTGEPEARLRPVMRDDDQGVGKTIDAGRSGLLSWSRHWSRSVWPPNAEVLLRAVVSTCGNQSAGDSDHLAHNPMLRALGSRNATLGGSFVGTLRGPKCYGVRTCAATTTPQRFSFLSVTSFDLWDSGP